MGNEQSMGKQGFLARRPHLVPAIIAAVVLFGAFGKWPYEYYQFVRWIVCAIAVFIVYFMWKWKQIWAAWILGILAILFNPLVPVHLERQTWSILDLLGGVIFLSVGLVSLTSNIHHKDKQEAIEKRMVYIRHEIGFIPRLRENIHKRLLIFLSGTLVFGVVLGALAFYSINTAINTFNPTKDKEEKYLSSNELELVELQPVELWGNSSNERKEYLTYWLRNKTNKNISAIAISIHCKMKSTGDKWVHEQEFDRISPSAPPGSNTKYYFHCSNPPMITSDINYYVTLKAVKWEGKEYNSIDAIQPNQISKNSTKLVFATNPEDNIWDRVEKSLQAEAYYTMSKLEDYIPPQETGYSDIPEGYTAVFIPAIPSEIADEKRLEKWVTAMSVKEFKELRQLYLTGDIEKLTQQVCNIQRRFIENATPKQ